MQTIPSTNVVVTAQSTKGLPSVTNVSLSVVAGAHQYPAVHAIDAILETNDASGLLEVLDGAVLKFSSTLRYAGSHSIPFALPLVGSKGGTLLVVLSSDVNTYLNVRGSLMTNIPNTTATQTWTAYTAASGAGRVVTLAADPENVHVLDAILANYLGAAGSSGTVTVAIGGTTKWEISIPTATPRQFFFPDAPIYGVKNQAMTITMSAVAAMVPEMTLATR